MNQQMCTRSYSDTLGCRTTVTSVTSYASVADFVDEVRVIPPLTRATATTSTTTNAMCPADAFAPIGTVTHSYDSQGRLIRSVFSTGSQTLNFSAWDSSGRPTTGTFSTLAVTAPLSIDYDNVARTRAFRTTGLVVETTFDVDGNPVRQATTSGLVVSTMTIANAATERVCR